MCRWRGCGDGVRVFPARYKLLLHVQQAHCKEKVQRANVSVGEWEGGRVCVWGRVGELRGDGDKIILSTCCLSSLECLHVLYSFYGVVDSTHLVMVCSVCACDQQMYP